MSGLRVHEIARRSGVSSKEVRTYLVETFGYGTKSSSSVVEPPHFAAQVTDFLKRKMD